MDARTRRILRQHVQTDALLGVPEVPLGVSRAQSDRVEAAPERLEGIGDSRPASVASPGPPTREPVAPVVAPAPLLRSAAPLEPLGRDEKITTLQQLDEQHVKGCTKCGLCKARTQTVFGVGDADAELMFIGEGPGQQEDEQGEPFVGRAGQLLNKMIEAMGYSRETVYIANVVKCRPPNNRTPTPDEADACWPYLLEQIRTVQPRVIVTVGGPATKRLLDTKVGITRTRGTWHQFSEVDPPIPVMPTFHPSYLLRSYTQDNRKRVWSDLQQVMQRLANN